MPKTEHATSDRSPLRRRLETAIQLAALVFFSVLGLAIYQNVSQRTPTAGGASAPSSIEARSINARPTDTRPREGESAPSSPNEPTPGTAPPSEAPPSEEGPAITGSSKPTAGIAPPSEAPPSEEGPTITATVKPEAKASSPKPLRDRRNPPQEAKEQRFKVQASERPGNQGS